MKIKRKIILLAILLSIIPIVIIHFWSQKIAEEDYFSQQQSVTKLTLEKVKIVTNDIYTLCNISNELLKDQLKTDHNILKSLIKSRGGLSLRKKETFERKFIFSRSIKYNISKDNSEPQIFLGDNALNQYNFQSISHELNDKVGMNLLIKLFLVDKNTRNLKQLYIDKSENSFNIISNNKFDKLLNRETVFCKQTLSDIDYLFILDPILDANSNIIAVIGIARKIDEAGIIKEYILNNKEGRVFSFILDSQGKKNNRKLFFNIKDNSEYLEMNEFYNLIISKSLNQKSNNSKNQVYQTKIVKENIPQRIYVSSRYYEPWDCIIGAYYYEDEFSKIENWNDLFFLKFDGWQILIYSIIVIFAIMLSSIFAERITRPITFLNRIAKKIIDGDIKNAHNELLKYRNKYLQKYIDKKGENGIEESNELILSFSLLTDYLLLKIAKYKNIQNTISGTATDVSTIIRQLESSRTDTNILVEKINESSQKIVLIESELRTYFDDVTIIINKLSKNAENFQDSLMDFQFKINSDINDNGSLISNHSLLNVNVEKLSILLNSFNKISEQLYILYLNASIEAEKAGEKSGGLNFISNELGNISERTMAFHENINLITKEIYDSMEATTNEHNSLPSVVVTNINKIRHLNVMFNELNASISQLSMKYSSNRISNNQQNSISEKFEDTTNELQNINNQYLLISNTMDIKISEMKNISKILDDIIVLFQKEI